MLEKISLLIHEPYREYLVSMVLVVVLLGHSLLHWPLWWVALGAALGSIVPLLDAARSLHEKRITIEIFNFFALAVSFLTGEFTSAAFIALMLAFASWLDWRTESRATNAVEELLKLKPTRALREATAGKTEEIDAAEIQKGDVLVVKNGERIPADGMVIFGTAILNEASLTGESRPVEKRMGEEVYSSTVVESGAIKIRATKVGKDSTLERMAALIREASAHKSKAERLADRFAGIFLPIVLVAGVITYIVTGNILMTAALFLIVCADDIAVSIPLAITASLGAAARRGVIVKGGEWIRALAGAKTLLFDKTGTLTSGRFQVARVLFEPGVDEKAMWKLIGTAEKMSEHPMGRTLLREAVRRVGEVPDPDEMKVFRGVGVWVRTEGHTIAIGSEKIAETLGKELSEKKIQDFQAEEKASETGMFLFVDEKFAGFITMADTPRPEAATTLAALKKMGLRLVMLTGDEEDIAQSVSRDLGIEETHARLSPEDKMRLIEEEAKRGGLVMVGDGVNDAPALARANVGIAMGEGGTAVAVEAADVVILTDELSRIPELIALSRRTVSVVNLDIVIWIVTNIVGVALVFTGIATPAFAAAYNFLTDFFPMLNSARLFQRRKEKM